MIIDTKEIEHTIKDIRMCESLRHQQYVKDVFIDKGDIVLYLICADVHIRLDKESLLEQLKKEEII